MEDAEQWKEAIGTELQALIDMGTWKLVPLPKGRKAVGCRMVLKRKFNLDGTVSPGPAHAPPPAAKWHWNTSASAGVSGSGQRV